MNDDNKSTIASPAPQPLPELEGLTKRESYFVLDSINALRIAHFGPMDAMSKTEQAAHLYMAIQQTKQQNSADYLKSLPNLLRMHLLPEEHFDWIDSEDDRLIFWLGNCLSLIQPELPPTMIPQTQISSVSMINTTIPSVPFSFSFPVPLYCPGQPGKDEIIRRIDIWSTTLEIKAHHLKKLQQYWEFSKTDKKKVKFLDGGDPEQMEWAIKYLRNKGRLIPSPHSTNDQQRYALILASLDAINPGASVPLDKNNFLQEMSKKWSQIKYKRSDKAKKQRSLPMDDQLFKDLGRIAKHRRERPSEVLERLINKEYRELFIKRAD